MNQIDVCDDFEEEEKNREKCNLLMIRYKKTVQV